MFEAEKLPLAIAVVFLSIVSGIASYLQGCREKRFKAGKMNLAGELFTSLVAGGSTLFLGTWQEYPEALTCLIAIIAAHNGKLWLSAISDEIRSKYNLPPRGKNDSSK